MTIVDPPGKARHATLMMAAACVLADVVPDDMHKRVLARYAFLYADELLLWARRWRTALKRDPETARAANAVKGDVADLADALDAAGEVRDYLAAKRQAVADTRADDIEATALLWEAVNAQNVSRIGNAAIHAYDALAAIPTPCPSVIDQMGLPLDRQSRVRAALPQRDKRFWQVSADTSAVLRPYTLPAAQGGNLGRVVAQANDVAIHLDLLLRIAPAVYGVLPYDWLVRSAIGLELSALLDLTVGPAPAGKRNALFSLLDLCRQGRAQDAADDLERLRDSIEASGWTYLRWIRNTIGAHVDHRLTMFEIHRHLVLLDYQGLVDLAEHVLNQLDAIGSRRLDLKLLLLTDRPIRSWPTAPGAAAGAPDPRSVRATLVNLFRTIDSPYVTGTSSSMASAVVAGVTAGRQPRSRSPCKLPQHPSAD